MDEVDPFISFYCNNCGYKSTVSESYAGKTIRCPKCYNIISIPTVESTGTTTSQSSPGKPETSSRYSDYDLTLLDISEKEKISTFQRGQTSIFEETAEYNQELGEESQAETEPVDERRLPWLMDIFLYPLNLAGIIHLVVLWLLVFLLCPLVMEFLGLGIEYIPIVYTLPVAYVLYYFAECIHDSAAGGCRAPDFWVHPAKSDKWDCISQSLVVLGCIAVCFWPVAVYYVVTERTDLIYWLLLACGGFFFPMVLLAVVLFDSYNALNPILLIGSILHTFLPYCGMVLLFYGGALLFMKIDPRLYRLRLLPAVPFIFKALQLYLMFVAVGLLGRFYWRYQEKLNWEV